MKTIASIFKSLNCVFPKCTFSGPQLNPRGLVWYPLNSSKAHTLRGLDNQNSVFSSSMAYLTTTLIYTAWTICTVQLWTRFIQYLMGVVWQRYASHFHESVTVSKLTKLSFPIHSLYLCLEAKVIISNYCWQPLAVDKLWAWKTST